MLDPERGGEVVSRYRGRQKVSLVSGPRIPRRLLHCGRGATSHSTLSSSTESSRDLPDLVLLPRERRQYGERTAWGHPQSSERTSLSRNQMHTAHRGHLTHSARKFSLHALLPWGCSFQWERGGRWFCSPVRQILPQCPEALLSP